MALEQCCTILFYENMYQIKTYKWPLVSLIWGWGYIFLAEQLTLTCWPVGKRSCWNVIEEAGAGKKEIWDITKNTDNFGIHIGNVNYFRKFWEGSIIFSLHGIICHAVCLCFRGQLEQ